MSDSVNVDDVRRGDYTLKEAAAEAYVMERMGDMVSLAIAVAEIFPDAPPMIPSLRVLDWPPARDDAEAAGRPKDYPLRIVAEYDADFLRFTWACTRDRDADVKAVRALASKTPDQLRDRYFATTQELHDARQEGDRKKELTAANERTALSNTMRARGIPIGHSGH